MGTDGHRRRAIEFLRVAHLYRLGNLPTEQPHPETRDLALWARSDLRRAIDALRRVDLAALDTLTGHAESLRALSLAIWTTLDAGRRVFLCGCGATGRLALAIEYLWRRGRPDDDSVRSFMAGGDVALVHSLEGFEDHPEYGARHLIESGFDDGDLLIACTEGGETPYVIGATLEAARSSRNPPWFLYCNPDEALLLGVERFRRVHADPAIRKRCLFVGPMALAGSTRMQASTVLELAVGSTLLHPDREPLETIRDLRARFASAELAALEHFVREEAAAYRDGGHVRYRVRDFGITVFTDTTERAPTFSLVPFARTGDPADGASLCSIVLDDASSAEDAWVRLLGRPPRAVEWPEVDSRSTRSYLRGFDFSPGAAGREDREFRIGKCGESIVLELSGRTHAVAVPGADPLVEHLLLKQMLNIHSTLVMGRLGRYEGNLMTWVAPTNGKLVDRAVRHVRHLLTHTGHADLAYEQIVYRLFAEMERAEPGESVVLRTFRALALAGTA